MRLKLISCEIFYREFCAAVSRSPNVVDVEFLPKGLHDIGNEGMLQRLQGAVDRIGPDYDAVLMGYGLCNNGIVGLTARQIPLVAPRAHDCITMFLGSKERYLECFQSNPGVFYETTGWIERGDNNGELSQLALGKKLGMGQTLAELVARYGEDNGRYLFNELGNLTRHYKQITFIAMGVEPDSRTEETARERARSRGWDFVKIKGDLRLIQRLVDGVWDDSQFLVVPPGQQIAAHYNSSIITAEEPAV